MRRKKLHIKVWVLVLFCVFTTRGWSQIGFSLTKEDVLNSSEKSITRDIADYIGVINLFGSSSISAKTTSSEFYHSTGLFSVPSTLANLKVNDIGSISLGASSDEIFLTYNEQVIFSAFLGLTLVTGKINSDLRLITEGQAWVAGMYSIDLILSAAGAATVTPDTQPVTITVPKFLNISEDAGNIRLDVKDLDYFRGAQDVSVSQHLKVETTVPYLASIRAEQPQFSFSTSSASNFTPATATEGIEVNFNTNTIPTATPVFLSVQDKALTSMESIAVPIGNSLTTETTFSISGAELKERFVQAGTYTVPINYTWKENWAGGTGLEKSTRGTLEVTVADLSELLIMQNSVRLDFTTPADYQKGVIKQMPDHLRVSKTTPFNLYVRAATGSFSSGRDEIPLEVLKIGPMAGETGMNTLILSDRPQLLLENSNPVIDRFLDIEYRIDDSSKLLGKPEAEYSTDIIYSFVAP